MKILYTQNQYKTAKGSEKLPLQCYQCSKTFYRLKRHIRYEQKTKRGRLKYCSVKCCNEGFKSLRKYTELKCSQCNNWFKRRTKDIKPSKSGNYFCNVSCLGKYRRKDTKQKTNKVVKKCLLCDKPKATKGSKYCVNHKGHRPNDIKTKQRTDNHTLKHIKERVNYDSQRMHIQVRAHCKKRNQNLQKNPCSNCGYSLHVQLCHIKAVSLFPDTATLGEINDPSNIATLCPNCHWEYDNGYLQL